MAGTPCSELYRKFAHLTWSVPGKGRGALKEGALYLVPLPQKNGALELEGPEMRPPLQGSPQS